MPDAGLRKVIDQAMASLSQRQREALLLTKSSGLTPLEAAKVLGTSEMAVKLRVHRAVSKLRATIERRS